MIKNVNRFLSMVLCAALLFGMLPGMTAFAAEGEAEAVLQETGAAAETGETTEPVENATEAPTEEATEGSTEAPTEETIPEETVEETETLEEDAGIMLTAEKLENEFSSFEELKMMLDREYSDVSSIRYVGDAPLVITEDVTIPIHLSVSMGDYELIIAPGANMYIEFDGDLYCTALTINGELTTNGQIKILETLTVNGNLTLEINGDVQLWRPSTVVNGEDNIHFAETGAYMTWYCNALSQEELPKFLQMANEARSIHYRYNIRIGKGLSLGNQVFPKNTMVDIRGAVTVPQGTKLTVESELFDLWDNMKLDGQLIISENARFDLLGNLGGKIEVSSSGSLEIYGDLKIQAGSGAQKEDLVNFLSGVDLSQFEITRDGFYWNLKNTVKGNELLGDVNGDGQVTGQDVSQIRDHLLERGASEERMLTEFQAAVADVSGDGKITGLDISLIRDFLLERIAEFPNKG